LKDSFDVPEVASTKRRIIDLKAERAKKERAVLIGIVPRVTEEDSVAELGLLAETAGAEVVKMVRQRRDSINSGTFLGKGKLADMKALADADEVDMFIFDEDLHPNQVRRLQDTLKKKILDRSELILDIFAARARSREARLQVELAQLEYMLPRLTKMWAHLSRTGGGIGTRGPGETQLETDRRLVRDKIKFLKTKMKDVEKEREVQRARRRNLHRTALVGYTNAGKSTLFNRLTSASVMAEDLLFATLDPTLRAATLPHGAKVIFSDTVGFISELPTMLIAAFRATLEEVIEADVILHVRDVAHEDTDAQAGDVKRILRDLDIDPNDRSRIIEVWNKVDLLNSEGRAQIENVASRREAEDHPILVSAATGEGIDRLLDAIEQRVVAGRETLSLELDPADGAGLGWLHRQTEVLSRSLNDHGKLAVTVRVDPRRLEEIKRRFPPAA
jgi:GTP-binding protein HflX